MIFNFLNKQNDFENKKKLTKIIIMALIIPEDQRIMYLEALESIDKDSIDKLYSNLIKFVEKYEIKEIEDISKNNYTIISWMQKKEALIKQKEINAFNLLINNI